MNASHTLRFALRTPLLLWHVLVDLPLTMLLIAHAVAPASHVRGEPLDHRVIRPGGKAA